MKFAQLTAIAAVIAISSAATAQIPMPMMPAPTSTSPSSMPNATALLPELPESDCTCCMFIDDPSIDDSEPHASMPEIPMQPGSTDAACKDVTNNIDDVAKLFVASFMDVLPALEKARELQLKNAIKAQPVKNCEIIFGKITITRKVNLISSSSICKYSGNAASTVKVEYIVRNTKNNIKVNRSRSGVVQTKNVEHKGLSTIKFGDLITKVTQQLNPKP